MEKTQVLQKIAILSFFFLKKANNNSIKFYKRAHYQNQLHRQFTINSYISFIILPKFINKMQALGEQQIAKLRQDFVQIDTNHDGVISKDQLQGYMKKSKIFHVKAFKINQLNEALKNKITEEDFVFWIMACKNGLEDVAAAKFNIFKQIQKIKSAGPASIKQKIKTSIIDIEVNKNTIQTKHINQHSIKLKAGIDKKQQLQKTKELQEVLGRAASQINLVLKIKTVSEGQFIAEKLSEIFEMGLALISELGPQATTIAECLNLTAKWHKEHVYLIIELNNTFLNMFGKYIQQASHELVPEGKCSINAQIQSDFQHVLQKQFDPLQQSVKFRAQLNIGEVLMSKLKDKLIDGFEYMPQKEQFPILYMFLFQELNLSMQFDNLKECFTSFGLGEVSQMTKSGAIKEQLKDLHIGEMIKQFLPDGDELLVSIKQSCSPQVQLTLNVVDLSVDLGFDFNVEGFFDIL